LRAQIVAQGFENTQKAIATKATQDAINAQAELAKFLTPTQTLQKAIDEANNRYAKAIYGVSDPALLAKYKQESELEIQKAEEDFDRATKTHEKKPRTSNAGANALAAFQNQVGGLTDRSLTVPGDTALTKYVQEIAQLTQDFDKTIAKGANVALTTDAYWKGAAAYAAEYEEAIKKANAADDAYKSQLDDQLQTRKRQIDLQVASIGMG